MKEPLLSLINLNKSFGDAHILKDITLEIKEGEFLTILGPSGCGKTTLLRCISGLENIDTGDILLRGKSIKNVAPNKRSVNTVFQNYALFPHLNVYDNIAYGPRVKKSLDENQLKNRITEILNLVQMPGYEERMITQLSGGQMQRIAVGRALINNPDILLLDEPLGALDLKLRKYMQRELTRLQKETKTTFVYITHDQEEALNMSDRIVVLREGRILQIGSPEEVYNNPKDIFVASFIGDRNMIKVDILGKEDEEFKIKLGNSIIKIRESDSLNELKDMDKEAIVAIHMDKMRISLNEVPNSIEGIILSTHYAGSQIRTEVKIGDENITIIGYQDSGYNYKIGEKVYVSWEESGAILLPMDEDLGGSII